MATGVTLSADAIDKLCDIFLNHYSENDKSADNLRCFIRDHSYIQDATCADNTRRRTLNTLKSMLIEKEQQLDQISKETPKVITNSPEDKRKNTSQSTLEKCESDEITDVSMPHSHLIDRLTMLKLDIGKQIKSTPEKCEAAEVTDISMPPSDLITIMQTKARFNAKISKVELNAQLTLMQDPELYFDRMVHAVSINGSCMMWASISQKDKDKVESFDITQ